MPDRGDQTSGPRPTRRVIRVYCLEVALLNSFPCNRNEAIEKELPIKSREDRIISLWESSGGRRIERHAEGIQDLLS